MNNFDTKDHPLRFVTAYLNSNTSTRIAQFYNSMDRIYHYAEYVPYCRPPTEYLCGKVGNFAASASTAEGRNICKCCADKLLKLIP